MILEAVAGVASFAWLWWLQHHSLTHSLLGAVLCAYVPQYFNGLEKKGGNYWRPFQSWWLCGWLCAHNPTSLAVEQRLSDDEQYIFCSFPHGACSVNHVHTMTDGSGFISKVYSGPRRDLCASILFCFPILREAMLYLGCVDASSSTAKYNLQRGRSLLIFIGGEKEQLMTKPNQHKIFLRTRKGFVKLALQYGTDLVPMYAFGENELYECSDFLMGFRQWLQRTLHIGIPVVFGRWNTLVPLPRPMGIEIGAPVRVDKKPLADITNEDIDRVHNEFMNAMTRLFDRTKHKHGVEKDVKLDIC